MNSPKFLIKNLLKSYQGSIDKLNSELYHKNILLKDYKEDNLILLYTKYNSTITSELQRECRSLVIDRNSILSQQEDSLVNMLSYSCEIPLLNNDGYAYLHTN